MVFKTTAIDHSANSPRQKYAFLRFTQAFSAFFSHFYEFALLISLPLLFTPMRLIALSVVLNLLSVLAFTQPQSYYMSARYADPNGKPYIDLIFDLNGKSLTSLSAEKDTVSRYQAVIKTQVYDEKDSVVAQSSELVTSPTFSNQLAEHPFLYLSRLSVPNTMLRIQVSITDVAGETGKNITQFSESIAIDQSKQYGAYLSDLVFVGDLLPPDESSPFYRNGQLLVPYVSDYFPTDINKLIFYTEIYNSTQQFPGGRFVYAYQIVHPESGQIMFNQQKLKRAATSAIVPVIGSFDLSQIPNGKYKLRFEVRNAQNELVVFQEKAFYRENNTYQPSLEELENVALANSFIGKVTSDSLLNEYLASLSPIASRGERKFLENPQRSLPTTEQKQRYFYNFWSKRNATQPDLAWYNYKKEVDNVNSLFGTSIKRGYQSDRGRVYLQYGRPDSRIERPNEPVSYPYEIWQYDQLESFTNVRFIFYDPSIGTNDYQLLHSEMRGEFRNPNWQTELQRRTNPSNSINNNAPAGNFGSNAKELFDNPR